MEQSSTAGYRARDAASVMIGAALVLLGMAWLILGTDPSSPTPLDDLTNTLLGSLTVAWLGASCMAIGLFGATFQLLPEERPSVLASAGIAFFGSVGLFLAYQIPVSWIGLWPPTDPRSQPSHIFAAVLFFGSFAAVFTAIGAALLVSRVRGATGRGSSPPSE